MPIKLKRKKTATEALDPAVLEVLARLEQRFESAYDRF